MKKNIRSIIATLMALAIIISTVFAVPFIAEAATPNHQTIEGYLVADFWVDPENTLTQEDIDAYKAGDKTTMVGAVGIHRIASSGNYYLFLPSNADVNNLRVWSAGGKAITIAGTTVPSGGTTNAFASVARGVKSGNFTIKVGSSSYTVNVVRSGDVGTIYIDLNSGSIKNINSSSDHSYGEGGTVMVVQPDGTVDYDGVLEKMQGRGNATWNASSSSGLGGLISSSSDAKNPYNLKLGVSSSLLGMPKAKKWVLLANTKDPYLIKDQMTYDFANYIGIKYQPLCKPVDVYCNQAYLGSYQLSEKVEIKSNRIDVNDAYENLEIANGTVDPATGFITPADLSTSPSSTVGLYDSNGNSISSSTTAAETIGARAYSRNLRNPTDITGGYLYELEISERWVTENAGFTGYNRQGWVIKSCDYASKDMVDYSNDLMYALGAAIYNGGTVPSTSVSATFNRVSITNPAPAEQYRGKKWSDLLDADSAVKYYWLQEYFKNMDASTSSTYFFKDSDSINGKLYAGPLWDMDHSIDKRTTDLSVVGSNRWGSNWRSSTGWYARNVRMYKFKVSDSSTSHSSDSAAPRSFYGALYYNNTDFRQMVNEYWYSTIRPAVQILLGTDTDPSGKLKSVDDYINGVQYTGILNNIRMGLPTSTVYDNDFDASEMKSEIKTWLSDRVSFVDGEISRVNIANATITSIGEQQCTGSAVEPEFSVSYNGRELRKGADYEVSYSANVDATPQCVVTITGLGYYTGSVTKTFAIVAGTPASATIYDSAYIGDTLTVNTKNTEGKEITNYLSYQWKSDGTPISGATDSTYTLTEADAGKSITVTVTGDGTNIQGSVTSNTCSVSTMERPAGFAKTLAAWDYDYTANASALTTADETGAQFYYTATSGEQTEGATLTGSVDGVYTDKIKWSGSADLYANKDCTVSPDQAPIIATSKSEYIAWGDNAHFETTVNTEGYQSITFSAKVGGTKKSPRSWKVQYSLDGVNFTDIADSQYTITANKSMEQAFTDVALPEECNNKTTVYIRVTICENLAINGSNVVYGQYSGDAAINNIKVKGESIAVITALESPTVATNSVIDSGMVFSTDEVVITDNNGGAPLYYTVGDSDEVQEYTGGFKVFDKTTAKAGDTVTVTAWADAAGVQSDPTVFTVTFGGVNLNDFSFIDYSKNVSNGAVFSTGGAYDESGKMTAYTDGKSQFVPLWRSSNGAFCVAPDDGAKWSADSGFYFEVATAGYEDIRFTAQMYTTNQGPDSVTLQYSTDGETWADVQGSTFVLPANGELENAYVTAELPAVCDNLGKLFVRVATKTNLTHAGDTLHNNQSKGNLYINNVVISGEDNGDYKMPYTNKTTAYFGSSPIKYKNASGTDMQYVVVDPTGEIILSGTYQKKDVTDGEGNVITPAGIDITSAPDFSEMMGGAYTVNIWAGDDDDQSIVNRRKYYYKGESVVKFSYTNGTKRPLSNYLDLEGKTASATSGANAEGSTLAMYPNGTDAAFLTYEDPCAVRVNWSEAAPFAASKNLDKPANNGYWLIRTSTKGFRNLTLNAEQLSTNKGPRDWGIAYSLNGTTYTYLPQSNVRAISTKAAATTSTVETYNNIALPHELEDQDNVYIKIFINGGESVDGTELELTTSGGTGINNIEISGMPLAGEVNYTFTTVAYEDKGMVAAGTTAVPAYITVNGESHYLADGTLTLQLTEGTQFTAVASSNSVFTFPTTVTGTVRENGTTKVKIIALDVVADGVINAKDYAMISKDPRYSDVRTYLRSIFTPFMNMEQ